MQDLIGRTLGHYRIVEKIGAGGMGVVYRAHDEHLDRDVAIKVLPEAVAQDEERLARFEREAKLLASLSHQNIAHLYGLESVERTVGEGFTPSRETVSSGSGSGSGSGSSARPQALRPSTPMNFLVMELAEGETLADRIERAPIPIDDAMDYARQIAEGLEAAHERGIIHRDLKPANVMLSPKGKLKILDFGLAKAFEPPGSEPSSPQSIAESPTMTAGMTRTGVLLGTAAYMSPEQARGKAVDKRTDVWAFGCVFYEMLTGHKVFHGNDASQVMAAILRDDPGWNELPGGTPLTVRRLLRRCLQKDPKRRLHDIADARIAIEEAGEAGDETLQAVGVSSVWTPRIFVLTAVVMALLGMIVGGFGVWWERRPEPAQVMAVQIETLEPLPENFGGSHLAVSPDGKHVLYVVEDNQRRYLVHRWLDQFGATEIPGSEDAVNPFFSPDNQWVGFKARGKLKKVSLQGGEPIVLCEGGGIGHATWSPDGSEIIFGDRAGSLWRVPAKGGEATILKQPDPGEMGFGRPEFLPDGRALLVEIRSRSEPATSYAVGLLDLESVALDTLIRPGTNPVLAPSGHLVFARGAALYAVAFDSRRRRVTGQPTLVLEGVSENIGNAEFSFSKNGTLAFVGRSEPSSTEEDSSLVWVDRQGASIPLSERRGAFWRPRLSPNGTRVAVGVAGRIEIYDIETETWQLLSADGWSHSPVWTLDGERIVFGERSGPRWLDRTLSIPADFSGPAEQIVDHEYGTCPRSFSPSGQLILNEAHPAEQENILVLPVGGGPLEYLVRGESDETQPAVSPNGLWLAYASDRSGEKEVFVEPFPAGGARVQVSTDGGEEPRWTPEGDELLYWAGTRMIAVPVSTDQNFAITGARQVLFENDAYMRDVWGTTYDVDRTGERFLMIQKGPEDEERLRTRRRIMLILNWFTELERLVPTDEP